MQALQLISTESPLEARDVPPDPPGPGDVVVRVRAAGICHSDVHYRSGPITASPLPMTLGHEVAGTISDVGPGGDGSRVGQRVCLHYQTSCGACPWCARGSEQFCAQGQMLGKSRPGGYAEFVTVPARNAFALPDEIPLPHAAVMMCSSATSLHALKKGRMAPGERVAVFGAGGLGMSAIQIAIARGAAQVFAIDINADRLALAESLGAVPVDGTTNPGEIVSRATEGRGVDVSLELIGLGPTMRSAIEVLRPHGRAVMVGLSTEAIPLAPYEELVGREAEIIGCSDHLASEIPELLDLYRRGALVLDDVVGGTVPLDADAVNGVMDAMEAYGGAARTVITP